MRNKLFPDLYLASIYQIPVEELKKLGICALVFDIDNTICPYDVAEPDEKALLWLKQLHQDGFRIIILSNNNRKRVQRFNEKLLALAVWKSGKPGVKKLLAVLRDLGLRPQQAAMIGDQVFTDVWCGHNGGLFTILTKPICNRDQLVTKVKRPLEKLVIRRYERLSGKK